MQDATRRQWFAERWWHKEEVLVTLAEVYGVKPNTEGWMQQVFLRAYQELHGAAAWREHDDRELAKKEVRVFYTEGELPYCVMRARIERISTHPARLKRVA